MKFALKKILSLWSRGQTNYANYAVSMCVPKELDNDTILCIKMFHLFMKLFTLRRFVVATGGL